MKPECNVRLRSTFDGGDIEVVFIENDPAVPRETFYGHLSAEGYRFEVLYSCSRSQAKGTYPYAVLPCFGFGAPHKHIGGGATLRRWLGENETPLIFVEPDAASLATAMNLNRSGRSVSIWSDSRRTWRMVGLLQVWGISLLITTIAWGMLGYAHYPAVDAKPG